MHEETLRSGHLIAKIKNDKDYKKILGQNLIA